MSDAPERITVHVDVGDIDGWRVSTDAPIDDPDYPGIDVEYVRADLYAELEQERDIFQDTVKKLAALEQERDEALAADGAFFMAQAKRERAEVERLRAAIARISAIAEPETRGKRPLKWIRKECVAALTKPEGER